MDNKEILAHCDHTLLKPDASWTQIKQLCDDAVAYGCASVCIPPAYVRQAAGYLDGRLKICTVIGFPNGYSTTEVKVFETEDAIRAGAGEIDMVINLGWVKERRWDDLLAEVQAVKDACRGRILKVIVEACLLTQEEKIKLCEIVTEGRADYLKTSTGFSTGGATREDVALFRANVGPDVSIKAAGGIRTLKDAAELLRLGAGRLGASALVELVKAQEKG